MCCNYAGVTQNESAWKCVNASNGRAVKRCTDETKDFDSEDVDYEDFEDEEDEAGEFAEVSWGPGYNPNPHGNKGGNNGNKPPKNINRTTDCPEPYRIPFFIVRALAKRQLYAATIMTHGVHAVSPIKMVKTVK